MFMTIGKKTVGSVQKTEVRSRKTECSVQKTEDRRQKVKNFPETS